MAGVKAPKALRKSAAVVATSPLASDILAGALIAAASAAAAALARHRPAARRVAPAGEAAGGLPGDERSPGAASARAPVDDDRVRRRAYEIWEREGRPDGHDQEYWHRARRDIENEAQTTPDAKT
jgi:hypothetical protein